MKNYKVRLGFKTIQEEIHLVQAEDVVEAEEFAMNQDNGIIGEPEDIEVEETMIFEQDEDIEEITDEAEWELLCAEHAVREKHREKTLRGETLVCIEIDITGYKSRMWYLLTEFDSGWKKAEMYHSIDDYIRHSEYRLFEDRSLHNLLNKVKLEAYRQAKIHK